MTVERMPAGENVALVDLIDRLIDGGVVVSGDIVLSVADVDLVYVGLRLILAPARKVTGSVRSAPVATVAGS
jgi:hypothetical protein